MKTTLKRLHQKMDNILQDIIDDHKMNMITTSITIAPSCKKDLVDMLLKLQKSSDLNFELTAKHVKAILLVWLYRHFQYILRASFFFHDFLNCFSFFTHNNLYSLSFFIIQKHLKKKIVSM